MILIISIKYGYFTNGSLCRFMLLLIHQYTLIRYYLITHLHNYILHVDGIHHFSFSGAVVEEGHLGFLFLP